MSLFHHSEDTLKAILENDGEFFKIISKFLSNENRLISIIDKLTHKPEPSKPLLNLGVFINDKFYLMADIQLTLGGTPPTGVFTLTDNKTGAVITATFTNQAVGTNSNPAAATFALDANNNVVPTALTAGTGTVLFSTHAAYTDPGDQQPKEGDFTVSKNFTVKTGADGATLDVVFS